jgi:hypothetical protein
MARDQTGEEGRCLFLKRAATQNRSLFPHQAVPTSNEKVLLKYSYFCYNLLTLELFRDINFVFSRSRFSFYDQVCVLLFLCKEREKGVKNNGRKENNKYKFIKRGENKPKRRKVTRYFILLFYSIHTRRYTHAYTLGHAMFTYDASLSFTTSMYCLDGSVYIHVVYILYYMCILVYTYICVCVCACVCV